MGICKRVDGYMLEWVGTYGSREAESENGSLVVQGM